MNGEVVPFVSFDPAQTLTFDQWCDRGRQLAAIAKRLHWEIGDWWNAGHRYGDRAKAAAENLFGLEFGTLRNIGAVASRFEMSRRRDVLPFWHHAEVAALPAPEADALLDLAERERLSVRDLRLEVIRARLSFNQAELEQIRASAPPPPEGLYSTIVVDPPWPMQKINRDLFPNQLGFDYPVMALEEIAALELPSAEAAHCYLWTTQRFLPSAFAILAGWGFDYLVTMIWCKAGGFQPFGLPQYNAEFILLGRRGGLPFTDTKAFPLWFTAPRREHSRKPDAFYDLVARVSPGPRLDMFSREAREGFDQWGAETGKFAAGAELIEADAGGRHV